MAMGQQTSTPETFNSCHTIIWSSQMFGSHRPKDWFMIGGNYHVPFCCFLCFSRCLFSNNPPWRWFHVPVWPQNRDRGHGPLHSHRCSTVAGRFRVGPMPLVPVLAVVGGTPPFWPAELSKGRGGRGRSLQGCRSMANELCHCKGLLPLGQTG